MSPFCGMFSATCKRSLRPLTGGIIRIRNVRITNCTHHGTNPMKSFAPAAYSILFIFLISMRTVVSLFASTERNDNKEAVASFKDGNYGSVVGIYEKSRHTDPDSALLAAVSYEKTGSIEEARQIYRELYGKDGELGLFAGYLLAKSYEMSAEYPEAVRRYRKLLSYIRRKKPHDFDSVVMVNAVLFRLFGLNNVYAPAGDILHSSTRDSTAARCLASLADQKSGNAEGATELYKEILTKGGRAYRIFVLRHIVEDKEVVDALLGRTLNASYLMRLYLENGLYDEAIELSYMVPEDQDVLLQRAESFIKTGMYECAFPLLEKLYTHTENPDLMYRLALAYFKAGDTGQARIYFDRYVEASDGRQPLPARAAYLQLLLQKKESTPHEYIISVSQFIETYGGYPGLDALIYRTFYFAFQNYGVERALSFLQKHVSDLNGLNYRAWAHYLFGLYIDPSYFRYTVREYPGSYYYFKAASYLKKNSDTAQIHEKAEELLQRSQQFFDEGETQKALQILIYLYSRGAEQQESRKRIMKILDFVSTTSDEKEPRYSIDYLNSGTFFRLFELGLYDDLLEMFGSVYPLTDGTFRYKLNYLISKIYYETGNVYRGLAYAQRMSEYINRDYLIFMDDDVRKLFYPLVYLEPIVESLDLSYRRIDRNFLLAIIREESRYKPDALSAKGAAGLMQLMPDTARWIMHTHVDTQDLFDPAFNIQAGAAYLRYLFDRFESAEEVLAAYNGGPNNVHRWDLQEDSVDGMVEGIPFAETREFVKKVFTSYKMYENIYGGGN